MMQAYQTKNLIKHFFLIIDFDINPCFGSGLLTCLQVYLPDLWIDVIPYAIHALIKSCLIHGNRSFFVHGLLSCHNGRWCGTKSRL